MQSARLENATDETYIEILLNTATTLNDYLSVQASIEGATSQELKAEILGDTWQRSQAIAINSGTEQAFQIALYPEAGMSPRAIRLYSGESTSFTLQQTRICALPAYVAETITKPLDFKEANLSTHETTYSLFVQGFRGVEKKGRWGLGPASEVSFWLDEPQSLNLSLIFSNPIAEQSLELHFNGQIIDTLKDLKKDTTIEKTYTLQAQPGINRLSLNYSRWNGLNEQFFTKEKLPFTVYFRTLAFSQADAPALADLNLATSNPEAFVMTGLSGIEANGRWALGPNSNITFETIEPQQLTFQLAFNNPIQGQSIELRLNDQLIDTLDDLNQGAIEKIYTLNTRAGQNNLGFYYKEWNGLNTTFADSDTRPMTIYITTLEFHQAPDAAPQPEAEILPMIDISEANLIAHDFPETLAVNGLAGVENEQYRWALGPESNLEFRSDKAQAFEVNMSFVNPIEGQRLVVVFNGAVLQELGPLHQSTEMQLKFYVNAIPGLNHLDIRYSEWNGKNITFAPDDKRPMAILFKLLEIRDPL